jgi:N-acetyl-gamma-glutamyl-phosphate reductase
VLAAWREWLGRPDATTRLMVHSGPFVRGIYLTLHAFVPGGVIRDGQPGTVAAGWFRAAYRDRPFVRVLDTPPELTHVVGTNYALVHAVESPEGEEIQVTVAIDNLVKGAGGQAIQAMNLALGIGERTGLAGGGIYPC